jgi:fumarate reductase subunit C
MSALKSTNFKPEASSTANGARSQLLYEIASGASGLALALFMWGHLLLVGSILLGARGFDSLAGWLEDAWIAQPTVVVVLALFLLHAAMASRKIPAQLRERRRMIALAHGLKQSRGRPGSVFQPHLESMLWIWQVRTGMVILVLGSFHVLLLGIDVLTPLFGEGTGIEAATSTARVRGGLWPIYAVLLLAVEFHASVGLYRLFVKWGAGTWLERRTLHRLEQIIFWLVLGLGTLSLVVLAGVVDPPLAFLLDAP